MTEADTRSARCPFCGCGFEPQTPDQRYCSPFCEAEDRKRGAQPGEPADKG